MKFDKLLDHSQDNWKMDKFCFIVMEERILLASNVKYIATQ